jgi:hypothetical protein
MADITLETLHTDLVALRSEIKIDLVRLEAKIDGKPSLMAMFTAVLIVVFGMASIIGTTIAVLANLHLLR